MMRFIMGGLVTVAALMLVGFSARAGDVRWNPPIPSIGSTNLVPNSGFELGPEGWSTLGKRTAWGGDLCGLFGEVQKGGAREGDNCLRIELGPGKTVTTYYDGWPPGHTVQSAPLAANIGWMDIKQGETYTLSAYMRADRPAVQAQLAIRFGVDVATAPSPSKKTKTVTLSEDWARYAFTLQAEDEDAHIAIGPDLDRAPDAAATVWVDAVQFQEGATAGVYRPREPVEVAAGTGKFGNVFDVAGPVELTIHGSNTTASAATVRVRAQLEDYFGELLPASEAVLDIPPDAKSSVRLALNTSGTGHYRAGVSWEVGGVAHEQNFSMAVIEPYRFDDSPFGINHAPTTKELCRQLQRAGIVWSRNFAVSWDAVEPVEGQRSFDEADRQIDREVDAGMNVLCVLPSFPSARWASEAPDNIEEMLDRSWYAPKSWARMACAPKDPEKLSDFIEESVRRYKDRVRVWEFLNEPSSLTALPSPIRGIEGVPHYTTEHYLDLLKVAYRAMKKGDPSCKVVGGWGLEVLFRAAPFIRAGGLNHVDILNIHPYSTFEDVPEDFIGQMEILLGLMDSSKAGRRPIWATEGGYFAEDDKPWTPWIVPRGHFSANNLVTDERKAADHSIRHAVIMLAHGVEKLMYHQGIEGDLNNGSMDLDNCFLGPLGTPQKLYAAQAALANLLGPRPEYAGPIKKPERFHGRYTDGVYGYAFQCGERAVLAAWAPDEAKGSGPRWQLKVPRDVNAYNIMGAHVSNGGNGLVVLLGESPIYLMTELMTAHDLANSWLLRAR